MSISRLFLSLLDAIRRFFGGSRPRTPKVRFLPCPNDREQRTTETIGPEGGTVKLGDHRIEFPRGAVEKETRFTVALLADRIVKLQVQANGEEHYRFAEPVSLTLSYATCGAERPETLRIYKIDPKTDEVVEELGGALDEKERTVTARLKSLSVYTLGSPT